MKKKLPIIVFLCCLLFSQCKKKDIPPVVQPEKESWQRLSESLMGFDARNIRTSYADSQNLMFFAYNSTYIFDSSFSSPKSYNYIFNSPGYINNNLLYKAGPHFRIFNNQQNTGIMITANQNASNSSLTYLSALEAAGVQGIISDFTAPDEQDNFYAAITTGSELEQGEKSFILYKYHLVHEENVVVHKELLWKKNLFSGTTNAEDRVLAVNAVDDIAFVTTLEKTYRIENGQVTDSTFISIRDVVKSDSYYVATCAWRATAQQEYPNGLIYSKDGGHNWQYFGTGYPFSTGQLLTIGDKLFLNKGNLLAMIDFEKNALIPWLRATDVNGDIRTLNLFHNKVYIGTDAGVYYKSLEGFMQPQ
jgi:hypothetical protein